MSLELHALMALDSSRAFFIVWYVRFIVLSRTMGDVRNNIG